MNMVLAGLRRKLETYKSAGMDDRATRTAAMIALYEAELYPAPEPAEPEAEAEAEQEPEAEEADPWAGVNLTPAARAHADEMGLRPDDFKDHAPSGKGGDFLTSDVARIAAARGNSQERGTDGDD